MTDDSILYGTRELSACVCRLVCMFLTYDRYRLKMGKEVKRGKGIREDYTEPCISAGYISRVKRPQPLDKRIRWTRGASV